MATIKIKGGNTTFSADKAGTRYEMAEGAEIEGGMFGIQATGQAKGRVIEIDGNVQATLAAIRIGETGVAAAAIDLIIGKEGNLSAKSSGIVSTGHGHSIRNAGEIHGDNAGIVAYGDQLIVNSGHIDGITGINLASFEGHGATIRNAGTIVGSSSAIIGSDARDTVINSGQMVGDILLGAGDDLFVFRSGDVDKVRGGAGNDAFVIKSGGLDIVEESGQGWDKVTSYVSHGLANNIEELRLAGKADIAGVGNASDNHIYGNAGDNQLYGGFGNDLLSGGRGDDMLAGAQDADQFHFARGSGHDTVMDFEVGTDLIVIDGLKGAKGFADMIAHHVTETDGDVWISYGGDVIVIEDTTASKLQGADFLFV